MSMVDHPESGTSARLTPLLAEAAPTWAELHRRHGPLLKVVETLLGVVPNCDPYLEIWPPAFRSYNVMVPNLLNLPVPILGVGGPPPGTIGLAMYVASMTAECPYCSAHTCSFAMRRGASPEKVAAALLPDHGDLTRGELAAIAVARSLARVPCELTLAERDRLVAIFGERHAEWVVLGITMMGFLNKFMDAIGVDLEPSVHGEVLTTIGPGWSPGRAGALLDPAAPARPTPPVDGLRSRLRMLPLLPAVIRYDRRVQRGVPADAQAVRRFLRDATGYDFPLLARLHSARARRSIASMLRMNLDPASSVVGLEVKIRAGAVFAEIVDNGYLAGELDELARSHPADTPDDRSTAAVLQLARAASPSPARIDDATIAACREGRLAPEAIVEIVTWLAVLQMLHRLTCYLRIGE